MPAAKFSIGQIIRHRLFGYRGVIYDVDPVFQGTEEWYQQMAKSRPPKDKPWYHVLVHGSVAETYVAERNLEPDDCDDPVSHPMVDEYFDELRDGTYHIAQKTN